MPWYVIALFVHIIGVLMMFIAVGLELTGMYRMRIAHTVEQVREWNNVIKSLEKVFPIATLLILLAGLYMVFVGSWGWTTAWVNLSIVSLVLMSILGPAINARRGNAIHKAAEAISQGPVTGELSRLINDTTLWTSVLTMTAVSVGVTFLMTVKPALIGALGVLAIALVVGIVLGQLSRRPVTAPIISTERQQA